MGKPKPDRAGAHCDSQRLLLHWQRMDKDRLKPLIFRVMRKMEDGLPAVGGASNKLGVRLVDAASPSKAADLPVDSSGHVQPGTGGMSVSPSLKQLPSFLVPRNLSHIVHGAAGHSHNHCWKMGQAEFAATMISDDLDLRPDRPGHGLVEPARMMSAEAFHEALADTRRFWLIDESEK